MTTYGYNSQEMETTPKRIIGEWINKMWHYSHNGISVNNKEE